MNVQQLMYKIALCFGLALYESLVFSLVLSPRGGSACTHNTFTLGPTKNNWIDEIGDSSQQPPLPRRSRKSQKQAKDERTT